MSELRSRWRALPPLVRDGVLAAVVTLIGQIELLLLAAEVEGSRPLQHLAFALMTGSLLVRRLRPVVAAATVAAGLAFQTLLGEAPAVSGYAAVLIVTYSVAQYADRRRDALLGLALIVAAVEVYPLVTAEVSLGDEFANVAIVVIVWVFARLARERLDRAVRAEREAAEQRERAREAEAARTAALRCTTWWGTGSPSCCCTRVPPRPGRRPRTRGRRLPWTSCSTRGGRRWTTCTACSRCCGTPPRTTPAPTSRPPARSPTSTDSPTAPARRCP
jgi:hypothetical protein